MNALKAVINPDNLIATDSEAAFVGAVVYWRLPGDIRLDVLEKAWANEKLDNKLLPKLPSAKTCLTRAVDDVAKGKLFKRRIKDGGYRIVKEENGVDTTECRATLGANEELVTDDPKYGTAVTDEKGKVTTPIVGWTPNPTHYLLGKLTAAFESHKNILASRDIGSWLPDKLMTLLGATTLRESGGVYFVPRDQVELLKRIVKALKAVSSYKVYQIKAMTGDEAVEAVLDAIVAEAEAAAEAVEVALAQGQGAVGGEDSEVKPLGPRALETRADKCREMVAKVRDYETLLGKMMPTITKRLEDLKVAAMEASLAAQAE